MRRRPRRDLPPDLLRDASRRLAIVSLVAAGLWAAGFTLGHLALWATNPLDPHSWELGAPDAMAAGSIVASLVLFAYVRGRDRDPRVVLNVGLLYMVLTAAALASIPHFGPIGRTRSIEPVISWIGVVVLMSSAIVPSTPLKTLIAALIAVSMNPLAMLIARARGMWQFDSAFDTLLMHYPDYLLVGVAVVISHVVTRLGQQVAKAREMGSYQLGDLLGRGGMGEVYKATHRMLARTAAIKLIRPEMLGSDRATAQRAIARFTREAETAASLRSPHTVELYDFGVTADQTLYFVMELLQGLDLESLIRQYGPMPAGRVIYILRQVCESLEEAHVRGLVHRDIKPANIHVGTLGLQYDFAKVLDFGLVKSVDTMDTDRTATIHGQIIGTPAYMAPELVLGDPVDARADLYALGCVAYFLLTGRQVFEADKAMQLVTQHMQAEPTPPSSRVELPVPAELDRIVLGCLAKKPSDRPPSAADLSRLLGAVATTPWTQDDARHWWSAHHPAPQAFTPPRPASPSQMTTRFA